MNILFLCTGNSCRSQMAEGFARYLGEGLCQVKSAGLEAHGINPRAIKIMNEIGIDITTQMSTQLTNEMLSWADIIITLCGHADEHCPKIPEGKTKMHWPFEDPAKAKGDEEIVNKVFRKVRDEIKIKLDSLLKEIKLQNSDNSRSTYKL